ncbi:MAG TPA: carboxylate-amine ligase [Geminicoccus sp.]|jgi:carboxylate-amine ligase|uniref:carboxylate-amine ligase n=1 Tax=Geminicoccus sp. TaxID=2024832 RepID=UPI002E303AA1|nr:carboxylate-amine ligase [Geminicoccus sp.]HEX2528828.1 carboxylate-amine ligase [Geminicoccus sp.]
MKSKPTRHTIGIEEEYLLVDLETRALVPKRNAPFFAACRKELGEQVTPELFQSQIEIATGVCKTVGAARKELSQMRATIAAIAREYGMAPIACSTHPFSHWDEQRTTSGARYSKIAQDYRLVAQRALVCGMHIHAGIEEEDERIRVMNRLVPYLPLFLALSASSPFWQGHATGMKAFRPTIFGELPRTGIPQVFADWAEWQAFTHLFAKTGLCTDSSKIWWDLRPSLRQPTLELRVAEICTHLEDTLTLAAMYQSLLSMFARTEDPVPHRFQKLVTEENKWRAQLSGVAAELASLERERLVPVRELVAELVDELAEDADALGCGSELRRANDIVARGTSADLQISAWQAAKDAGLDDDQAGTKVVDLLIGMTVDGTKTKYRPTVNAVSA